MLKRSEFYTFMVILMVFLGFSVSHAVSYQPQIIQPTKPYQKSHQYTAADANFNTVLDTTSGAGVVNKVNVFAAASNDLIVIKITVDGVAYEIKGPTTSTVENSAAGIYVLNATTAEQNKESLLFHGPLFFKTSIKIEVSVNSFNANIQANVDYALE